jgi:beta-aspartyl-peptidase (threonine type)
MPKTDWKLAVHGGAGFIERSRTSPEKDAAVRAALDLALQAGGAILESGGSAVDAVEAAVKILEDDPNFNAGRGSVFTWDGVNEMDASIMDGATRAAGAVATVTATRNPVSLARAVMDHSAHAMLSAEGADSFSRDRNLEQAPPEWFARPDRRHQLEELKTKNLSALDVEYKYGTVGAVALDTNGHVAAATSTGGMTGKRWGRVGDSPLIGAGTYADDRAGAVSATGHGEYFIRVGVAHEICARMRLSGDSGRKAADDVLAEVKALGGNGGVIVVTVAGEIVQAFNTAGMNRGKASAEGRSVALYGDEER